MSPSAETSPSETSAVETLERAALERLQLDKLRSQVALILEANPFYRAKLEAAGIRHAADVGSLADLPRLLDLPRGRAPGVIEDLDPRRAGRRPQQVLHLRVVDGGDLIVHQGAEQRQ